MAGVGGNGVQMGSLDPQQNMRVSDEDAARRRLENPLRRLAGESRAPRLVRNHICCTSDISNSLSSTVANTLRMSAAVSRSAASALAATARRRAVLSASQCGAQRASSTEAFTVTSAQLPWPVHLNAPPPPPPVAPVDLSKQFDVVVVGGGHSGCEAVRIWFSQRKLH